MIDSGAGHTAPIDPSLSALRPARRVALGVIALVVGLSFAQHPAPSLSGSGLGVSLSLIGLIAAAGSSFSAPSRGLLLSP